jgi:hypothetical protein
VKAFAKITTWMSNVNAQNTAQSTVSDLASLPGVKRSSSRLLSDEGMVETEDEAAARKSVISVFNAVLNRDPSEAEFLHFRGCILDGVLNRDSLKQQIAGTFESIQIKELERKQSEVIHSLWMNSFYPWICVEDDANNEPGTVCWKRNDNAASEMSWFTKDVPPGIPGAQIVDGKLFVSNLDVWVSVAVSEGLSSGKHVWTITKKSR